MLQDFKRRVFELVRCTRHNYAHLKIFKISSRGNRKWIVKHPNGQIIFDTYPYLAMHDIEGYMQSGGWRLDPGSTVIDAGGCFGEFALYASQCVGPSGRVLMLEPDADNIRRARENFELNGNPANIKIIPAALWNARQTLRFTAGQSEQSSLVSGPAFASGRTVEVAALGLAELMSQENLDRLDFMKMDIEGAELEACEAVGRLPAHVRPRFAIASYHVRDGQPTSRKLEQILGGFGYAVSTGNPRHQTTWAEAEAHTRA